MVQGLRLDSPLRFPDKLVQDVIDACLRVKHVADFAEPADRADLLRYGGSRIIAAVGPCPLTVLAELCLELWVLPLPSGWAHAIPAPKLAWVSAPEDLNSSS